MPAHPSASIGLLSTHRQRQILNGLQRRHEQTQVRRQELEQRHQREASALQDELAAAHEAVLAECRTERHQALLQWDEAEERVLADYETATLKTRDEISRVAAKLRRTRRDEKKSIVDEVEKRRKEAVGQYNRLKNRPLAKQRKNVARIDKALASAHHAIEGVRNVVVRRLDELPEVAPLADSDHPEKPLSVHDAEELVQRTRLQIEETGQELFAGTPAKLVDRVWVLPSICIGFLGLWTATAFFLAGPRMWLALVIGIVVAFFLYLVMLTLLQIPLRRQTRHVYPRAEHLYAIAHRAYERGKAIAAETAAEESAQLVQQRDSQLHAADRWKQQQLEAMEKSLVEKEAAMRQTLEQDLQTIRQRFQRDIGTTDVQMREKAGRVATAISQRLQQQGAEHERKRQELVHRQQAETRRLEDRLHLGISRGLHRIRSQVQRVREQFPDWDAFDLDGWQPADQLDFLPVGSLDIADQVRQYGASPTRRAGTAHADTQPLVEPASRLPVVLHRQLHAGLVIECPAAQTDVAVGIVQGILWQFLTRLRAGHGLVTLIDPVGRGQHFAGLIALADHDPGLVHHRVWTTPPQIEARLLELTQHTEDVLQSCLRDRYPAIEDYNRVAGSLAEPYRAVAAVGLPTGLTVEAATQMRALIDSARRCGNFLLLVRHLDQPWPTGLPPIDDPRMLRLVIDARGNVTHGDQQLKGLPFQPVTPPPASLREQLVEAIGDAAVNAARVQIPLDEILPQSRDAAGDAAEGLEIPIGSQGASRIVNLKLGDGVKQHVLIAGKTGSGKSTLLHSIITAGARRYRPDQLQMYLLDFKKGVEFQIYAEGPLPHARVIGIESEREFGRSVLERLDTELHQRGEQFRSAGVQEIGEYRRATGEAMPRVLLVFDEFQELFIRDDRLAGECAMFLDRLVRQGRSFGMHVILSSQSLAGSYSLPRATLGQMAVRIALQCGESDAALILSDENTAARLLTRPGEAIYNDAGGLIEGNQPFQVAWLDGGRHQEMLHDLRQRDAESVQHLEPPVIFSGSRPSRWTPALADAAGTPADAPDDAFAGLLGESIEIGPPTTLRLQATTGRNVLVVAPADPTHAVLAAALPSMVADCRRRFGQDPEIIMFDGNRQGSAGDLLPSEWLESAGVPLRVVKLRDAEAELVRLQQAMNELLEQQASHSETVESSDESSNGALPMLLVITPLERFRELRQTDSYSFSLDAASGTTGPDALQAILRDGPQVQLFTLLCCHSSETLTRWLPRSAHHDLELRLLARMSASDSSNLIDSPEASDLSAATMLLYDDADGRLKKFRYCNPAPPHQVRRWLDDTTPASPPIPARRASE